MEKIFYKIILGIFICSLLFSTGGFLYCGFSSVSDQVCLYKLLYFIPPLILYFIYNFTAKNYLNFSKIFKFLIGILSVIILVVQVFFTLLSIAIIVFIQFDFDKADPVYTNPVQYNTAKKSIWHKSKIRHFPDKIPEKARNIIFEKSSNSWLGSEEISLGFKIDRKYIDKEIKKHHYKKIDEPYYNMKDFPNKNLVRGFISYPKPAEKEKCKFYVIGGNAGGKFHNFPMEYGIAVDYLDDIIIFYYELIDI